MQVEGTRLFRVRAVAEMFDVSVATIYREIESGRLGALRIGTGDGTVRVPEAAIRIFREACAANAAQAGSGGVVSGEVA